MNSVVTLQKDNSLRVCTKCNTPKCYPDFGIENRKDGPSIVRSICNACRAEDTKKRREAESPEDRRNRHLLRHYGITTQEYNKMFADQQGTCLGCKKHQTELKAKLVVDHDHTTDEVRGLLCEPCNLTLGHAKDNPETLRNLAEYLEK